MHKKPDKKEEDRNMLPLGLLTAGEKAQIITITPGKVYPGRLEDMGLRVGKIVEMLNNGGRGPLLLKVDEARIAMARAMAMKITVRRKEK